MQLLLRSKEKEPLLSCNVKFHPENNTYVVRLSRRMKKSWNYEIRL